MPSHFKCYWTAFVLGVGIFIMSNEIEIWLDIPTYEGLYQVSSWGRVKSLIKWNGTNERILKQAIGIRGYLVVNLMKNGKRKLFPIHQLVAMAFKGHKPDGTHKICVDHIDNDKHNNRADNLNLVTSRENNSKDRKNKTSKFTGVHWDKDNNKWRACIDFNGRFIHLGYFELDTDASNAYKKALDEWCNGFDLNTIYPRRVKSSKYKGVSKCGNRWRAVYKRNNIGFFATELEAHEAVQNYIKQLNIKENDNKVN